MTCPFTLNGAAADARGNCYAEMLIAVLLFSFTLWFGLYLIARDPGKPGLLFAGLGLVSYSGAVAFKLLVPFAAALERWNLLPLVLTSIFWTAATFYLVPRSDSVNIRLPRLVVGGVIGVLLLFIGLTLDLTRSLVSIIPLGLALYALVHVWLAFRSSLPRRPLAVLFTATLFFALGLGMLLLPLELLPGDVILLAISADLILLGYAIGGLDAYDEGVHLLPGALRSLAAAGLLAAVFGGQVALVIGGNFTLPRLVILMTVIASAIILETFSAPVQGLLDRLVLTPRVLRERRSLRAVNDALPNVNETFDLNALDETDFARLTRRAFSHFGDLNKLAASPLTHLPIITTRLTQQGKADTLLERSSELKLLLAESVARLRPEGDAPFGTSDEWRFYNVLYFPYIVGLKPYSRRTLHDDLDAASQAALDWFQTYVPERTLYNWQNAAASLIAQHLRELSA